MTNHVSKDWLEGRIERIPFSTCWYWVGSLNRYGYPQLKVKGKKTYAHKVSYELYNKKSQSKIIRHTCDTPCCVNPQHLLEGSHQDNSNDMKIRGRSCKNEKNGMAKFTWHEVEEIRKTYVKYSREFGARPLAKKYGVSVHTIFNVIRNFRWKS